MMPYHPQAELGTGSEPPGNAPGPDLLQPSSGDESGALPPNARILVVEDDEQIGRLLERILSGDGFDVIRVTDVASAWEVLDGPSQVDLLFSDVVLPGVSSGVDLAAALRSSRPDLPIVLTSGYDRSRAAAHPGLLEAVTFLPKPFNARQVRAVIRDGLRR